MEKTEVIKNLETFNKWRRGEEGVEMPDVKEIGITLDNAVKFLKQ